MKLMSNRTSGIVLNRFSSMILVVLVIATASSGTMAQDAVYRSPDAPGKTKVNGKITKVTPDGVTIGGNVIPVSDIRKVVFSREPKELGRARDRMEAGRYADCILELDKIKPSARGNKILPEIDFLRAYSRSQISSGGGNVTAQEAEKELGAFITAHPESHLLYPAIEQYGKQLFAFGKLDLAAAEFKKLSQLDWPEYRLKGYLGHAEMLVDLERYDEAMPSLDAIMQIKSNDDSTQLYQLIAQAEKAKIVGLKGNVDASTKLIKDLIREQSSENQRLFSHLQNALGAVYEKSGDLKKARFAYLQTELLYPMQTERHAEALYHLALIWPKLDDAVRASRAREYLKSRYRNSYWASKF